VRVLAIDPGKTTGLVVVRGSTTSLALEMVRDIAWADRFVLLDLINELATTGLDRIVVERFVLRMVPQEPDVPSAQVIGIVDAAAHLHSVTHLLAYQLPSCIARVAIPDDIRPRLRSPHLQDAFKHARYYVVTTTATSVSGDGGTNVSGAKRSDRGRLRPREDVDSRGSSKASVAPERRAHFGCLPEARSATVGGRDYPAAPRSEWRDSLRNARRPTDDRH
jgi:hypothetical protein